MLFKRRQTESLLERVRVHLWPRRSWSRSWRYIIYRQIDPKTRYDLWVLPMFGERKPFPFLQTAANEGSGVVSPDGKWLVYWSKRDGARNLYVMNLSDRTEKRITDLNAGSGAMWPHWQPAAPAR